MASFNRLLKIPHIYIVTNLVNGKIYIGQTNGDQTGYFAGGVYVNRAIKKYGKKNFSKEVLISGNFSRFELDAWEIFYIKLFCATEREIGYNKLTGGVGGNGLKHTPEAIEKIRKRSQQEDNRIRIREIQKEQAIKRKGIPRTEETRLKISLSKRKSVNNRVVEQYNLNNNLIATYYSITDVYEKTGIGKSGIKNVLYGICDTCKGFIFKFKEIII